jgi:succinate dehydrogenase / fumarate reductase, membrane anchor subunit
MNNKTPSYKSLMGRARGLGSAKAGTHHWYMQRVTAVALFFLWLFSIGGFIASAVFGGYDAAHTSLHSTWTAASVIIFLIVAFHHAHAGLQVVIEDYVHCEVAKTASILAVKFAAAVFAVLGILATAKVYFGA